MQIVNEKHTLHFIYERLLCIKEQQLSLVTHPEFEKNPDSQLQQYIQKTTEWDEWVEKAQQLHDNDHVSAKENQIITDLMLRMMDINEQIQHALSQRYDSVGSQLKLMNRGRMTHQVYGNQQDAEHVSFYFDEKK